MSSYALNAFQAPDAYAPQFTLSNLPIGRIRIDISNQAVYYQLQRSINSPGSGSAGTWETQEVFLFPGSIPITRPGLTGVRIRAAIPLAQLPVGAKQAIVTVEAVPAMDHDIGQH